MKTNTARKESDLVFSEGVDQCTIDIVDGKAKGQNNHIFGHGCARRVSETQTSGRIIVIGWGIHEDDLRILKASVMEQDLKKILIFFQICMRSSYFHCFPQLQESYGQLFKQLGA